MRNTEPADGAEELVIRFKRQTFYADEYSYNARIVRSPLPLRGGDFRVDIDDKLRAFGELFESRMEVSRYYLYDQPPVAGDPLLEAGRETLVELGTMLYELLPLDLRYGLLRWVQSAYVQGRNARLVLEAQLGDRAERLLALPWELLLAPEAAFQPARSPRFAIERRLIGAPLRALREIRPPAHVIHLIAAGEGDNAIGEELVAWECEQLPALVGAENYQRVTQPGSVEGLIEAQRRQPAQILHFLGHGKAASDGSQGDPIRSYLQFVGADRKTQHVTGEQLQQLLHDGPSLQMVVLTACYTGTATQSNIAYDLVASGFPYVVAMQNEVPQPVLSHFVQRFYEGIQQGWSPARAVAAGRHAIAARFPGALDWCLPVLYSGGGLPLRSTTLQWIDAINRWLTFAVFRRAWLFTGGMGAAHLGVACLLWLSGVTLPPLDGFFLVKWLGWLLPAALLLTLWYALWGEIFPYDGWPAPSRGALFLRIWGAVAASTGLIAVFAGYFVIGLWAGLGFWSLLSPLSQAILLFPPLLLALLFGMAQAHNHGQGFVNSNRVQAIPLAWGDGLFVFVGTLFVLLPGLLTYFTPAVLTPPLLNWLIAGVNLPLAFLLWRESRQESGES